MQLNDMACPAVSPDYLPELIDSDLCLYRFRVFDEMNVTGY
jgi:hypothetical protein